MAIEIVDFPMKNGDFPLLFVCSPEGIFGFDCLPDVPKTCHLILGVLVSDVYVNCAALETA